MYVVWEEPRHYTVKKYKYDVIVVIFNVTEKNNNNIGYYPDKCLIQI